MGKKPGRKPLGEEGHDGSRARAALVRQRHAKPAKPGQRRFRSAKGRAGARPSAHRRPKSEAAGDSGQ